MNLTPASTLLVLLALIWGFIAASMLPVFLLFALAAGNEYMVFQIAQEETEPYE